MHGRILGRWCLAGSVLLVSTGAAWGQTLRVSFDAGLKADSAVGRAEGRGRTRLAGDGGRPVRVGPAPGQRGAQPFELGGEVHIGPGGGRGVDPGETPCRQRGQLRGRPVDWIVEELRLTVHAGSLTAGRLRRVGYDWAQQADKLSADPGARKHYLVNGQAPAIGDVMRLPALALIDGNIAPRLTCATQCIIEGDAKSMSIAAASIIAKVTRDRIMVALDAEFPHYGFASHKGYSTPEHFEALQRYGPCLHHRRSFAPVREIFDRGAAAA